jgi:FKBP-type peptidyl-prolyl cis-trans isomerase
MPSYLDKVITAIRADADHRGTSRQQISKYLKTEFNSDNKSALRKALKTGVEKNKLTQDGQRFRVVGDKSVEAPDTGFRQKDIDIGDGLEATAGCVVTVSYKGKLLNGTVFDKAKKFVFTLGMGDVIQGWDVGVVGMRVGGKRKLICPPNMAYGKRGSGKEIPPNSTLKFTVKLLKVSSP